MKHYYRARNKPLTSVDDVTWLRNARDEFRGAFERGLPNGQWPLKAPQMDRVIKAIGVLQHVLHEAIEEAREETGVVSIKENDWVDFARYGHRPVHR